MSVNGPDQTPLAEVLAYGGCPRCKGRSVARPGMTWWGSNIGPRLLNHAECQSCGYWFNWKTGEPNAVPVVLFLAVIAMIVGSALLYMLTRKHPF
jgi:hypothetical protein